MARYHLRVVIDSLATPLVLYVLHTHYALVCKNCVAVREPGQQAPD